jgi:hypothetical protein
MTMSAVEKMAWRVLELFHKAGEYPDTYEEKESIRLAMVKLEDALDREAKRKSHMRKIASSRA